MADAPEPRGLKRQEYDYVEGWKIVDLKIMNEALGTNIQQCITVSNCSPLSEIAQKCGHSQVVLVESNRKKMRADLAAHLGKAWLDVDYLYVPTFSSQPTCASPAAGRRSSPTPATPRRSRLTMWSTRSSQQLVCTNYEYFN